MLDRLLDWLAEDNLAAASLIAACLLSPLLLLAIVTASA